MEQPIVKNYNQSMSQDITALASAFLLAKREFSSTGFGGTNSHQKYEYAKIGDIYRAVEGALSKNNIIIWHFARPEDGIEYLHTRLIHVQTGQFIEDCRILESEKPGNQGRGAANTYMKKYALLSLCAIATEDDDGEDEEKYIAKNKQESGLLVKEEIEFLHTQLKSCSNGKVLYANILKDNDIRSLTDLPFASYASVKSYIEKNRQ